MFDLVIRQPWIVDGTGRAGYQADIGVQDGKIAKIGGIPEDVPAKETIRGEGCLLVPGFIDAHSHFETAVFDPEFKFGRIMQGITSDIVGNCGPTPAPYDPKWEHVLKNMYYALTGTGLAFDWNWKTMGEYLNALERNGSPSNIASLIGHGTLRTLVMGHESRPAARRELDEMKAILAQSLEEGAVGLGLGLSYVPGMASTKEELLELASVCREHGAIIAAHRRDEGHMAVESVDEMLQIALETGVKMQISHLKVTGKKNWGKSRRIFRQIEDARAKGADVMFDVYPYVTGYIKLCYVLPPWALSGSEEDLLRRLEEPSVVQKIAEEMNTPEKMLFSLYTNASPEGIVMAACEEKQYLHRTLADIAGERGEDPISCAIGFIRRNHNQIMMICCMQNEEELESIIAHPLSMICSDGAPAVNHSQHPRYKGTFIRILDHYVKEKRLLTLEEAVKKMTSLTARRFSLEKRGELKEGYQADMLLLDFENLRDNASYERPDEKADGVLYTIVNGQIAAKNGNGLNVCAGSVLRRV